MPTFDISIIIVNWNSKAFLYECLKSLSEESSGLSLEILVVDNASRDGADQMIRENFAGTAYIQSEHNLGFSKANNLAAKHARADTLLFLNPDTVVHPGALAELLSGLHRLPNVGAVGAKLLNTDGTLQTSCILRYPSIIAQVFDCDALRERFPRAPMWGMRPLYTTSSTPVGVEVISGACLMVKRAAFEGVGGFDERYFMYSEDTDLCYRIRQAGYECFYVSTATVTHHGGGSSKVAKSSFSNVMLRESTYRFMRVHRGRVAAILFRLSVTATAVARMFLLTTVCAFGQARARRAVNGIKKWTSILRWSLGFEGWSSRR